MKTQPLYQKYRPRTWADVVGQDTTVTALQDMEGRAGFGGRAFLLSGPSGTGKTTIAGLIAASVADSFFVTELDATRLTPARLAEIEVDSHYSASGKGGRVFIVNECHGLSRPAVTQLLTALERIPEHVTWIFTTTRDGLANFDDLVQGSAFLSRCVCFPLAQRGLAELFAARAREIADAEGLNGQPITWYLKRIKEHRNNLRAVLEDIERGLAKERVTL